jgi:hypothetical protein
MQNINFKGRMANAVRLKDQVPSPVIPRIPEWLATHNALEHQWALAGPSLLPKLVLEDKLLNSQSSSIQLKHIENV